MFNTYLEDREVVTHWFVLPKPTRPHQGWTQVLQLGFLHGREGPKSLSYITCCLPGGPLAGSQNQAELSLDVRHLLLGSLFSLIPVPFLFQPLSGSLHPLLSPAAQLQFH